MQTTFITQRHLILTRQWADSHLRGSMTLVFPPRMTLLIPWKTSELRQDHMTGATVTEIPHDCGNVACDKRLCDELAHRGLRCAWHGKVDWTTFLARNTDFGLSVCSEGETLDNNKTLHNFKILKKLYDRSARLRTFLFFRSATKLRNLLPDNRW